MREMDVCKEVHNKIIKQWERIRVRRTRDISMKNNKQREDDEDDDHHAGNGKGSKTGITVFLLWKKTVDLSSASRQEFFCRQIIGFSEKKREGSKD